MPIRINLLTEALAEEDMRRRDPAKRAVFIGLFLVAFSLVWFSSTWLEYKMDQKNYNQVQDQIRAHTNDFSRVQNDMRSLAENRRRLADLEELSTNRFLQGNLMNALQKLYVPNVQLIGLKLDQSYVVKAGSTSKASGDSPAKTTAGSSTEQITLTLDARDFSPNPGDQVNHFKNALATLDYFKSSLSQSNGVRLLNLSAPQTGANGKPFVQFTLECRFPDKTR